MYHLPQRTSGAQPAQSMQHGFSTCLKTLGIYLGGLVLASVVLAQANVVYQGFPINGPERTAWEFEWNYATGKGLFIKYAKFRRAPGEPLMEVIHDARLSDIHVPYHSGAPRFLDLHGFQFDLLELGAADAGANGTLLNLPGEKPYVVMELRDRGLLWKQDDKVYRGEEVVVWGALEAAYYNYIIQYTFRDDGSVLFRLGATATNRPSGPGEAHMHSGLWRVDVDLNGSAGDTALQTQHLEPHGTNNGQAHDQAVAFGGGHEAGIDWVDEEFTMVRIVDENTPLVCGKKISYDVMPIRRGTARHFSQVAAGSTYNEDFTLHDLWVTQYVGNEWAYMDLPTYVSNQQAVQDNDLVLWVISSAHHLPRHEDGRRFQDPWGNPVWTGAATLMWSGFDMRPRNLTSGTPHYVHWPAWQELDCSQSL